MARNRVLVFVSFVDMMDRVFASIMFIPFLSHLLRHTRIDFWDQRGLLDIMVV